MQKIFVSTLLLLLGVFLHGQKAHFQAGLVSAVNQSDVITQEGTHHYGYRIGVDSKLVGIGVYVLTGAHYFKYSSVGQVDREFFNNQNSLHVVKGRMGIGISPFSLTPLLKIRLKALGSYNYVVSGRDQMGIPELKNHYIGIDFGAGVSLGILTIDVEYEKGYKGILSNIEDSKFNIMSVTAGLSF